MTKRTIERLERCLAVGLLASGLWATSRPVIAQEANSAASMATAIQEAPRLRFEGRLQQGTLGKAYEGALDNLLRVNTVPDTQAKHNLTGLMANPPGTFIRAGGGYGEPWTRDASLNSWNAGSLLEPVVARNTLWAVCQKQPDGSLVLQRDNQWWDKVIWITGAWSHYKVTGDQKFLELAYSVTQDELALTRREHFNSTYGLFQGPAFFADGIAGYPEPEYDPTNGSSFVLDHRYTKELMSLGTNCVYYNAYKCAALMAKQLGRPAKEAQEYTAQGEALKTAINRHLWMPEKNNYAYFIHGAGPLVGQRDQTQEGIGISFAILFGVADAKQTQALLQTTHRSPHGITTQWPHFARFSDEKPGRHNVSVWPMVNGMWACAAAQAGDVPLFRDEVENVALLALDNNNNFHEIYNAISGKPDGGWQGGHWGPLPDQTWSATAYLRMMYQGLFGMDFQPEGLKFAPHLPAAWGTVSLQGLHYRGSILDITLQGQGSRISHVIMDGQSSKPFVPTTLTGRHILMIALKE
ncbi:hypothetical protein IAD21_00744 [Abditibacteriota bacterium]|nr:hypothetical protein IAD21_00744 [Abditibacteriota bacterium]